MVIKVSAVESLKVIGTSSSNLRSLKVDVKG